MFKNILLLKLRDCNYAIKPVVQPEGKHLSCEVRVCEDHSYKIHKMEVSKTQNGCL